MISLFSGPKMRRVIAAAAAPLALLQTPTSPTQAQTLHKPPTQISRSEYEIIRNSFPTLYQDIADYIKFADENIKLTAEDPQIKQRARELKIMAKIIKSKPNLPEEFDNFISRQQPINGIPTKSVQSIWNSLLGSVQREEMQKR